MIRLSNDIQAVSLTSAAVPARIYHPAFGEVVRADALVVPDDPDEQVAETISLMRRYALEDARRPEIRRLADEVSGSGPPLEQAARIWNYVRESVAFANDASLASPLESRASYPIIEVLIRPADLVSMCRNGGCRRLADCDDYSMLIAALLAAKNIRCRFVTVAADPSDGYQSFSHVYVAAYAEGRRIPLDASHGPWPGWEVPIEAVGRIREWPVNDDSYCPGAAWLALVALAAANVAVWVKP
jgi:transglutaminase-like putative cysteine protease